MPGLPQSLWSAAQTRELDRTVIEQFGVSGGELMRRAGQAAFGYLRRRWPEAVRIAVVCGSGNNGGDGYVVAAAAHDAGLTPVVLSVGEPKSAESRAAQSELARRSVAIGELARGGIADVDLVVDAVLGTGLARAPAGAARAAIEAINAASAPVFALDIPSGLSSDTGAVPGVAVRAEATMTFIALKIGLFTGRGREFAGDVAFSDLDVPAAAYDNATPLARRITADELAGWIRPRPRDAHKGAAGHVLVIGGDEGMAGAARMAGEAACRVGAGLVSVATRRSHAAHVSAACPELMAHGVEDAAGLEPLLARASVIAVGPGLGRGEWGRRMWQAVLHVADIATIVDADALNLLAEQPVPRDDWILTPHPGEAARLLGSRTAEIQADRVAACRQIVARYRGVCLLKGSGTMVGDISSLWLCDLGNPGMGTGGMGDVLTGALAGLRAQGLTASVTARLGAWLHAGAGDRAAQRDGERGMLATDLLPHMRHRLNRLAGQGR